MSNLKRKMPSQTKIFEHWENKLDEIHLNQCFACSSLDTQRLERAHILARCNGGDDSLDNLHLLCRHCHISSELMSGEEYWLWFQYTFDHWLEITLSRCKPRITCLITTDRG